MNTNRHVCNTGRLGISGRWQSIAVGCCRLLPKCAVAASFAVSLYAASFDQQREAVSRSVVTQPETAIISLLEAGLAEGKSGPAIAVASKWLRQNLPENPMLLHHAGRAAELSGDWKGAVALYQQYLEKADLKSEPADEAVFATYILLIERLGDTASAYTFSRTKGDRLLVCPRAKQFDTWFLDEATRRRDVVAVANRLHACIKAGFPNDLLIARYENYFRWLLNQMSENNGFRRDTQVTQEIHDAGKNLASVMTVFEELKLALDWAVSIRFYVQQRLAEKEVAPPVAEAKALLAKYPQYALWVQTGWIGGNRDNHPNHVGDYKYYWAHELDAKMAPVVEAAAKLSPLQRTGLLQSWQPGYYNRQNLNPAIPQLKVIRDYLADPKLAADLSYFSPLAKPWEAHSPEEALELAPKIIQNRHPETSLVRVMAAGITSKTVKDGEQERIEYARDYDKMLAALRGPEAWRLTASHFNGQMTDRLWHYCGRPGGNEKRDAEIAKSRQFGTTLEIKLVAADAPANQRMAEFRKLWADYKSPQPKIPDVRNALMTVLKYTPEVIPELLKDSNAQAEALVRNALEQGMSGSDPMWAFLSEGGWHRVSTGSYNPVVPAMANHRHQGIANMKQQAPQKCNPHPLESVVRAQIAENLKQNKLAPWQVQAWINMQYPEDNAEQIKLMQAMFNSPAWKTMPFEVQFSARNWFKKSAMTAAQVAWLDAADPAIICKDLLALTKDADVPTTVAALTNTIAGVKKSPVKLDIQGMDNLAGASSEVFADPQVMSLILNITDGLRYASTNETQPFAKRLFDYVAKQREPVLISRTASCLWQYGASGSRGHQFEPMKNLTESLVDTFPAAAYALARQGVQSLGHGRNIYGYTPSSRVPEMKALLGKAAVKLGLMVIPVAQNSPAYPVYKSQGEWMLGNEDTAWTLLDENWQELLPNHRNLDIGYLAWILQRTIYIRDEARQEELVKTLLAWAGEAANPFSPEQRVELELAYGDIAVQRGMLKEALQIYSRTQSNKAYEGVSVRHQATLRRVRVERLAKDFDGALKTLDELEMERIPELWDAIHYARGEVYYDLEDYAGAADELDKILTRNPDHAEAKVMLGKVNIKRQKLIDAIELDVVPGTDQNTLVPGEKLKVTLNDPTLAVSGAGTEIEVAVWSKSGDAETFFLRQFGDNKTKFRGEVMAQLGEPIPGDRVLQILGDDEVYYSYTDRFRTKMNMAEKTVHGPMTIASNALLMASARKLLSEAEQRVADMERKMQELTKGAPVSRAAAAGAQAMRAAEIAEKLKSGEDMVADVFEPSVETRVKPGNPIHVRVIDPDRSRTAGIDELAVSVETSSGDQIGRVVLKETGTHTGTFEGSVPTANAQAMAFAENSEPGRNPNMVISPVADYPAWRPQPGPGKTPEFRVDLNDNVPLGEMTIAAREPGAKLQKFVLMTGMNDREMTPVAVFPNDQVTVEKPWHPSVTVMNDTDHHHVRDERSVYDIRELEEHLSTGWMRQQYAQGVVGNVDGPSQAMAPELPAKVSWKRQNLHGTSHVIYRFRGYFHEPAEVTRRFRLELGKYDIPKNTHPSVNHPAQFMLAVDGQPITDRQKTGTLEGEINLRAGLHRFEIWATGWNSSIGFGRAVKLLANLEDAATLTECPDSFFDPERIPKDILSHRNAPAAVTAGEDGTQFKITFAPDSRARLLKLALLGHEGPVPALNKLALTQPDGKRVLPVPTDYAQLNKNSTLEILVGDTVTVRYLDDRFVTKSREKHERFLNASYSTGSVAFQFFEMRKNRSGEMEPYYEKLLRFEHGKPVTVTVNDADMDISVEPDTVEVTIEDQNRRAVKLVAAEDGPSTGFFRVTFTPVAGVPAAKNQIQVAEGGTLTAIYRDAENPSPGVPADRYATIEHAVFSTPKLRLAHAVVEPIDFTSLESPPALRGLNIGFETIQQRLERQQDEELTAADRARQATAEAIVPRWQINSRYVDVATPPDGGIAAVHGQLLHVEIEAPFLATRLNSTATVYFQTETGRKRAASLRGTAPGAEPQPGFDTTVPGTIKRLAELGGKPAGGGGDRSRTPPQIPIYIDTPPPGRTDGGHWSVMSTMLFVCSVPLVADFLPEEGVLSDQEVAQRREKKEPIPRDDKLVVRPGERVHVGLQYKDKSGAEQWVTGTARVITHPVLDVLEEDGRTALTSAYVGETLYLRVVDLGADVSDDADAVEVLMQAKSGTKYRAELREPHPHSGVFKGGIMLSYRETEQTPAETADTEYDVRRKGFPVVYGDTVGIRFTNALGQETETHIVTVSKGADGSIAPFSKKYDDQAVAVQTQFALADSYLALARKHRALGKIKEADLEFDQAKQLLASSIDQLREPQARAQAEYLLGTLTMEEADIAADPEVRETRYRAALSRFMNVTSTYADTMPASKAQFQTAVLFEKLREPEVAAQEYVKLAYKYPESEHLATAIGKLGTYFLGAAKKYEDQAKPLLAKTEDKDAQFEGTALWKMAVAEYLKSARMFSRLQERFPSHELAGPAGLRAGQAYMRAEQTTDALNSFLRLIKNKDYDGVEIRAQAMYWAGLCYEKMRQDMAAYSMYKRLTYDFPESKWASYSRAQLSQDKLQNLETSLEIKRLEEGR